MALDLWVVFVFKIVHGGVGCMPAALLLLTNLYSLSPILIKFSAHLYHFNILQVSYRHIEGLHEQVN